MCISISRLLDGTGWNKRVSESVFAFLSICMCIFQGTCFNSIIYKNPDIYMEIAENKISRWILFLWYLTRIIIENITCVTGP